MDRRLSEMEERPAEAAAVRAAARALAADHAGGGATHTLLTADALIERVETAAHALLKAPSTPVDPRWVRRAHAMAARYIHAHEPLFAQRLRAEAMGPHGDVLIDVAAAVLDYEVAGRDGAAAQFFSNYVEFTGQPQPGSLMHFYAALLALERCTICAVEYSESGIGDELLQAQKLLALACDHLVQARTVVAVIGGISGAGKSTLASALGQAMGWTVIHSQAVRRDIVREDGADDEYTSPHRTRATYNEMARRAQQLLAHGESVILEGSFARAETRIPIRATAKACGADLIELRLVAPPMVARQRARRRNRAAHDDHHGGAALLSGGSSWPTAHRIDTTRSLAHCLNRAIHLIEEADRLELPGSVADAAAVAPLVGPDH